MPVFLLGVVFLFFPERELFFFSVDEGFEMMWAMLFDNGYAPYTEIWMDQPPTFTYLLWLVFQVLGYKVGAARYLTLLFSCGLVWSAFQLARTIWGLKAAYLSAIFVIFLPDYIKFSVAVMQSIPNLALALLALFLLVLWHRTHRWGWLMAAALALSASILIKLYTGFLAPIFMLGIFFDAYQTRQNGSRWLTSMLPVLVWALVVLGILVSFGIFVIGVENLPHLYAVHVDKPAITSKTEFTIWQQVKTSYPFIFLGLVGAFYQFQQRNWLGLYPFAWMLAAFGMLAFYHPVWDHYKFLVTAPAALLCAQPALLAADFLGEIAQLARQYLQPKRKYLLPLAGVLGLALFFLQVPKGLQPLNPYPTLTGSGLGLRINDEKILALMSEYAPQTHWVIADSLMYPVRARLLVPPNLAVISLSRLNTGHLTEAEIITTIDGYHPEQILITRYDLPAVEAHIQGSYYIVHQYQEVKLYIRNDLPDLSLK